MACFSLLEFTPVETISWFDLSNRSSVNDMLNDIVNNMIWWNRVKLDITNHVLNSLTERYKILFISHTCRQEEIGIVDSNIIKNIILKTNITVDDATTETNNISKAYDLLHNLINSEFNHLRFIDLDACVLNLHKILMINLQTKMSCGGKISTDRRFASWNGHKHEYPIFKTEYEGEECILSVLDRYNELQYDILSKDLVNNPNSEYLLNYFKCATWMYYNLISLHPFGDGNGRLCRLLLEYVLSAIVPFPVPLAVLNGCRDIYIEAIVLDRKSGGIPLNLTTLVIESVYTWWNIFVNSVRES